MRPIRIGILVAALVGLTAGTALAGGGNSAAAHACQNGGYVDLVGSGGETFRNTGECVSFAARGGTFMTLTGIVVPAGATVTFDNPTLSACNTLSWGYAIDATNVALGGKAFGCMTATEADTTVGPFATTVALRVFLTDELCQSTTYYSDGNHAVTVQSSPTTWDVDIADAGGSCERRDTAAVFTPPGNLSVDVIINP
jgi:hypothetical protein